MPNPLDNPGGQYDSRRVEMFSDAVMAVAITVMVLRISPPSARGGQGVGEAFWNDTVPDIIFFLITFAVIVIFWTHHHDIFKALPRGMSLLALWVNMAFLACICLLPFGLEFFTAEDPSLLTVGVYSGLMAVATLFLGILGRIALGSWQSGSFIGIAVFLLAIPLAPLMGAWCLMVWWLDPVIERVWRRVGPAGAGA